MPRIIREKEIKGYAHCPNPYCDGHVQEQVPAVEREVGKTFRELGGGGNGLDNHIERSWKGVEYVNPEDVDCKHCGIERTLSAKPRPHYANVSGYAQNGLTTIKGSPMASGFMPKS
jgi:hypothetical protein